MNTAKSPLLIADCTSTAAAGNIPASILLVAQCACKHIGVVVHTPLTSLPSGTYSPDISAHDASWCGWSHRVTWLSVMQESLDREQQKLGQHLQQEIKARKAREKALADSLTAAAAAAAADVAALAAKSEASLVQLTKKSEGLAGQQEHMQERQQQLAGTCDALQRVGSMKGGLAGVVAGCSMCWLSSTAGF